MSEKELKRLRDKIRSAIYLFLANDGELLSLARGIHEQTISHRIAVYLEPLFNDYHVDCEYNKYGDGGENKKIVRNITETRRSCTCKSCKEWIRKNPANNTNRIFIEIRPDVIIHKKRGNKNIGNILVIEIKKDEECLFDQAKLKELTLNGGDYEYDLGVFVYFPKSEPEYKWFVGGVEKIFE